IFCFFSSAVVFAQAEYVRVENPIYEFLERMETQQIIKDYNSFELPKTRRTIANYLKEIIEKKDRLDNIDKNVLNDFLVEFEFDLFGTENNSQSIFSKIEYDLFNQKEKYLFYFVNPLKANLFINLLGEGEFINRNFAEPINKNHKSFVGIVGGEVRGTFLNKFGFGIRGTNGNVFGNKTAAFARKDLQYNFKLNENPDETFFDETEGYLTADFDIVKFKIGRDRMNIGYGITKSILAGNSPLFDYVSFNINYDFFYYSYFHGKLLGNQTFTADSITGGSAEIEEKYIGYHRIGFNFSNDVDFGIGEIVIYGGRPLDLSYVNPFNFYKSVEHANQDRDNTMLFVDFNNNSIKGLKFFATFLIDDLKFDKIGTGWYGNKTMLNLGILSTNLYNILPVDFHLEYLRIEPYTFTHRLIRNAYTNFGYNLSADIQPNTELFFSQINYRFNNRVSFSAGLNYSVHGANNLLKNGTVQNVGGDINLGHRTFDSDKVTFLDGDLEYERKYFVTIFYEPINQFLFSCRINFVDKSNLSNESNLFLGLNVKL
ncbi:MAG: capsule assembly Wzi family protein, partial [Ignavibacteriaceae bacterium]